MRKLYQLKKWYTIEEAANRLTLTLGEPVSSTEVLRLMADGELGVFWYVQGRDAVEVAPANWYLSDEEAEAHQAHCPSAVAYLGVSRQSEKVILLRGVCQIEAEVCRGSSHWMESLGTGHGGSIDSFFFGTLLVDEDGRMWELLERLDEQRLRELPQGLPYDDVGNYRSSGDHPKLEELIVTKRELERFEAQFLSEPEHSVAVAGFQDGQQSSEPGPWGNHETKLLRALAEASYQWWRTYDRDDKTTAPTNEDVAAWLRQKHGVAQRVAEVMAQILRADDIPQGPRRK